MRSTSPWIGTRAKTASWCHPISDAECVPLALFVRKGKPHLSPGPLLALSWAAPSPAALSTKGPLSVGGCFAYSCAVIAVDGGILPRNQEKVKAIEAKSDFNTVDYKLKAEETGGHGGPPLQERSKTRRRGGPPCPPAVGATVTAGGQRPPLRWGMLTFYHTVRQ